MDDLAKRIIYKWEAGGKKPMLVSTPGKGKTAFVNYLGKKLGVNVKAINTSTFEGVDANGMPYINPDTHELNISKAFWLEGLKEGDISTNDSRPETTKWRTNATIKNYRRDEPSK